jgi:hypothetical protein
MLIGDQNTSHNVQQSRTTSHFYMHLEPGKQNHTWRNNYRKGTSSLLRKTLLCFALLCFALLCFASKGHNTHSCTWFMLTVLLSVPSPSQYQGFTTPSLRLPSSQRERKLLCRTIYPFKLSETPHHNKENWFIYLFVRITVLSDFVHRPVF